MEIDQATLNDNEVDATETNVEPTMQDTMLETMRAIKERDSATSTEAEPASDAQKADKPRAPDGKFAKAPDATAPVSDKPVSAEPSQAAPAEVAPAIPATVAAAPSSWTAEGKAEWAKLTPAVQKEVLKRESDFHRYYKEIEPMKQAAQFGQSLHKVISPFAQTLQGLGVTPDVAIHHLLATDHRMRYGSPQEKMAGIAAIAKGYGIDLSQGLPEVPQVDPNLAYFQQQQQATQQAWQQQQQEIAKLKEAEQRREQESINMELAREKQNKPHFDELSFEIGTILQSALTRGQDITIDQAYEQALWASPTHRQELLAKQLADRQAEEAQKRAEDAAKAAAARKASSVNVSRRGTLPPQAPVGSMEDTARATLEAIRGR